MGSKSKTVRCSIVGSKCVVDREDMERVLTCLRDGALIVYPTDTLYGLGANPYSPAAMKRLYAAKRRPLEEPISMSLGSKEEVPRYGRVNDVAVRLIDRFLPGPLTLVLVATDFCPSSLVSPDGKIGIRLPNHPLALAIAKNFGPITATSANRHGGKPPSTCDEAREQLGDDVAIYVDAGPTPVGLESTVVDVASSRTVILREGAISKEVLMGEP